MEGKMQDGGTRINYGDHGAMREPSTGKGRFDLLSPFTAERDAKWMELGAAKYDTRNWEKGIPFSRLVDSLQRHINRWKQGDRSEDHLAALRWNAGAMMHFEGTGQDKEWNDYPNYAKANPEPVKPVTRNRLLSDDELCALPVGSRVYVEEKSGSQFESDWHKKISRTTLQDSGGENYSIYSNGLGALTREHARVWWLRPTRDEMDANPWPDVGEVSGLKSPPPLSLKDQIAANLKLFSKGEAAIVVVSDECWALYQAIRKLNLRWSYSESSVTLLSLETRFVNAASDEQLAFWVDIRSGTLSYCSSVSLYRGRREGGFRPPYANSAMPALSVTDVFGRNFQIYAVDFDGCLCSEKWPEIGEANTALIDYFKAVRQHHNKVILWTCREGKMLDEAVLWCNQRGLEFDAINDNLPEMNALYGNNSRKVGADWYYDDKSRFASVTV